MSISSSCVIQTFAMNIKSSNLTVLAEKSICRERETDFYIDVRANNDLRSCSQHKDHN